MYNCSPYRLYYNQDQNGNTDSMMWICQSSRRSDGSNPERSDDDCQNDGCSLQTDVQAERQAGIAIIECGYQNCCRDDGQEGECRQDAMSDDEASVLRVTRETIAHAVVTHGVVV